MNTKVSPWELFCLARFGDMNTAAEALEVSVQAVRGFRYAPDRGLKHVFKLEHLTKVPAPEILEVFRDAIAWAENVDNI